MILMAALNSVRQQQIDATINALKSRTGLSYPKNNLLEIANEIGVSVSFVELPMIQDNIEIDGIIKWDHGNAKILINDSYNPTRKTFTLAHELGHFLLHPEVDKLRIDKFNYRDDTQESRQETEANYFAASLLMPKDEFVKVVSVVEDISAVAKYFGVSEIAVKNRLRWIVTKS